MSWVLRPGPLTYPLQIEPKQKNIFNVAPGCQSGRGRGVAEWCAKEISITGLSLHDIKHCRITREYEINGHHCRGTRGLAGWAQKDTRDWERGGRVAAWSYSNNSFWLQLLFHQGDSWTARERGGTIDDGSLPNVRLFKDNYLRHIYREMRGGWRGRNQEVSIRLCKALQDHEMIIRAALRLRRN